MIAPLVFATGNDDLASNFMRLTMFFCLCRPRANGVYPKTLQYVAIIHNICSTGNYRHAGPALLFVESKGSHNQ
jgi:hypothetical protein